MKKILSIFTVLFTVLTFGQNVDPFLQPNSSPTSGQWNKGSLQVDGDFILPTTLNSFTNPSLRDYGKLRYDVNGEVVKVSNGEDWNEPGNAGYYRITDKDEIEAKAAQYGYIIIADTMDFGSTPENRVELEIPDGTTVKITGNGLLKDVRLKGRFKLEAGRKKIFENVEMYWYEIDSVQYYLNDDLTKVVIPAEADIDFYDWKNDSIIYGGVDLEVNPLYAKPIQEYKTPIQVSTNWFIQDAEGNNLIRFAKDGSGNVFLFNSYRYVFLNATTNEVLARGIYFNPANLKVGIVTDFYNSFRDSPFDEGHMYANDYGTVVEKTFCHIQTTEFFPEWWGVEADVQADHSQYFNQCFYAVTNMGGGAVSFDAGRQYYTDGGIIAQNYITLEGNSATIRLIDNATDHMFINDPFKLLWGFDGNYITFNGNKDNQTLELNGVLFTTKYNEDIATQTAYSVAFGYTWDKSTWIKPNFQYFSGSGFDVGIPGDVSMFNPTFEWNDLDGLRFTGEHVKLYEGMAFYNGRDGISIRGNHFRLVGGALAHNYRNGLRCESCSEYQVIGVSVIDHNENNIHLVSNNAATFTNIRTQNAGRAGVYLDTCFSITFDGGLANNNNQKSIVGTHQYDYNQALSVPDLTTYNNVHLLLNTTEVTVSGMRGQKDIGTLKVNLLQQVVDLASASALYNLVGYRDNSTFKYIIGQAPTNAPTGIAAPYFLELETSYSATTSVRMKVTVSSYANPIREYVATIVYDVNTGVGSFTSPFAETTNVGLATLAQTVTNGVTTSSPSQDAVYDFVTAADALKANKAGDTHTGTHNFTGTTNVATPTYPHSGSQAINGDYLSTAITNLELYKLRPVNTVLSNTDANFTGSVEYNQFVTHTGNTAALEDILPPIDPEYIGVTFWFFNNSTESVLISTATGGFDIIEENIAKVSYTLPVGEQVTMRMNGTHWVVVANGL